MGLNETAENTEYSETKETENELLQHKGDDDNNSFKPKTDEEFIEKIITLRILYDRDETNDFYLLQYMASILDYVERKSGGFLTSLGWKTMEINIQYIYGILDENLKNGDKTLPQKDLTRFCLYMTNCFAITVLLKGMIEIAFEENSEFLVNNPLPTLVVDDLKVLSEKCTTLIPQFKSIMDKYSLHLKDKYRSIYNQAKHRGFVKQLFNTQRIETGGVYKPSEIMNARECK
jgi:hypothetical protein